MPKKAWSKTKLNKELWSMVSNWIKNRDGNQCWRCKKIHENKSAIHCSHILPKGEYPNYALMSWNLKTLCMHCHLHWWHKNPLEASAWLQQKYPEQYKKSMEMLLIYSESKAMSYEAKMALYLKLKTVM